MIDDVIKQKWYEGLAEGGSDGKESFFVGIKSKGIFCSSKSVKVKPEFDDLEFFESAKDALLASYIPCSVTLPLSSPDLVSEEVVKLVDAVLEDPKKRWSQSDFKKLSENEPQLRVEFKKLFGMTFVEYARAARLGIAMKKIRAVNSDMETKCDNLTEVKTGFKDAFFEIMKSIPFKQGEYLAVIKCAWIETKLGPMIACSDEKSLYLLEFVDKKGLEREIENLRLRYDVAIVPGISDPIEQIQEELEGYFNGTLKKFKTPFMLAGSDFQKLTWDHLLEIPYGKTKDFDKHADAIAARRAYNAIANAHKANQLAIIIPCHRITGSPENIEGYGGCPKRQKWLLDHEKTHKGSCN